MISVARSASGVKDRELDVLIALAMCNLVPDEFP
jgi:hypothetical protein